MITPEEEMNTQWDVLLRIILSVMVFFFLFVTLVTQKFIVVRGCKSSRRKKQILEKQMKVENAKASFCVRKIDVNPSFGAKKAWAQKLRNKNNEKRMSTPDSFFSFELKSWWKRNRMQSGNVRGKKSNEVLDHRNYDAIQVINHIYDYDTNHSSSVCTVGLDCEMVGAGRGGTESLLARCSVVTLGPPDNKVKVLYDTYVQPIKKVTDYRTQWSGITPEHFRDSDKYEVVTLEECRMKVMELLNSSRDGKVVVVVGHALENDFKVLKLQHPRHLTRDTSTYPPFMLRGRKKMYKRKLADLALEELGMEIQNNSILSTDYNKASSIFIQSDQNSDKHNPNNVGHSSVEDAAASLMLYWKYSREWETSLGLPLRKHIPLKQLKSVPEANNFEIGHQSLTLYLDGCNLPISLRFQKNTATEMINNTAPSYQLISKTKAQGISQVLAPVDWLPIFRSILSCSSNSIFPLQDPARYSRISKIVVMFDGASLNKVKEEDRPKTNVELSPNIYLEITNPEIEVDDVIVQRCREDVEKFNISKDVCLSQTITVNGAIDILSQGLQYSKQDNEFTCQTHDTELDSYIVVRRKGGGTKSNKKLFNKLNLRRPEEGALCLLSSFFLSGSNRLQRYNLQIARELKNAKVQQIVDYRIKKYKFVRSIVITDDVYLADRVVKEGGIVMNYKQLQQIC